MNDDFLIPSSFSPDPKDLCPVPRVNKVLSTVLMKYLSLHIHPSCC